jgi:acyl-CoA reductase-like NAD-dependent aldehyde dehydrogenase
VSSYDDLESVADARRAAEQAHEASVRFRRFTPEQVDAVVDAMARAVAPECRRLAELAVRETGYGNAADKELKNLFNTLGVADWLRHVRTLGVLWKDESTRVMAIGEPMGVVAAIIPVTNPTSTVIYKSLSAVKAGNAVVHAPHPRGTESSNETARVVARAADEAGAPPGLIQCLRRPTLEGTGELMRHHRTSVVMATGGAAMVKAAYSSGKPTLAVGPGNVPVYVDRSMRDELAEVAAQIVASKSFDYGTACVAEQAIVAHEAIAEPLRHELRAAGAYFCTSAEGDRLGRVIFRPDGSLSVDDVGQAAAVLAERAGFSVPPRTKVLIATLETDEIGQQSPMSAEKLDPALAFYTVRDLDAAVQTCAEVLRFGGEGHTLGVHSHDGEVVARLSELPAGRVLVNTPCLHGGMGFSTDLEPSFMLGTGTWSGSIVSDNVTALHLINIKRIAYESRPWRSLADYTEVR